MVECSPPAGVPATEVAPEPPPKLQVAPNLRCPVLGKIQLPFYRPNIGTLDKKDLNLNYQPHKTLHLICILLIQFIFEY